MKTKQYTCDCCPENDSTLINLISAPIDYRMSWWSILDGELRNTLIEELCMVCRDCLELLDPSCDDMSEWLCKRCVIREDDFWDSLIKLVEESYYEV